METGKDFKVEAVSGPQVWSGTDFSNNTDWVYSLPVEIVNAINSIIFPLVEGGVTQHTFQFEKIEVPGLRAALRPIIDALAFGRGFSMLRGLSVEKYSTEELKLALLIIGHHMGLVGPQDGHPKSIGEVRDINPDSRTHYYHGGGPLPMHMDPVDAVGLLCIRKAKKGGESQIVSSMAVHNEILKQRPDLMPFLYRGFQHRRRNERLSKDGGKVTNYNCPIFADVGGQIVSNYIPRPIRLAVEQGFVSLSSAEEEALTLLDETAARDDLCLKMDLMPGDIQFLNNRLIMHGRADYLDFDALEDRRLMLRLWLTIPEWDKYPKNMPHSDVELKTAPA